MWPYGRPLPVIMKLLCQCIIEVKHTLQFSTAKSDSAMYYGSEASYMLSSEGWQCYVCSEAVYMLSCEGWRWRVGRCTKSVWGQWIECSSWIRDIKALSLSPACTTDNNIRWLKKHCMSTWDLEEYLKASFNLGPFKCTVGKRRRRYIPVYCLYDLSHLYSKLECLFSLHRSLGL